MEIGWPQVLAFMLFLSSTTGPIAMILQLVAWSREHSKSLDSINEQKVEGDIDERKRVSDLAAAEAVAATKEREVQAALIKDMLRLLSSEIEGQKEVASNLKALTEKLSVGYGIEQDRLAAHDKQDTAWRATLQDHTVALVGIVPALSATADKIAIQIEQSSTQNVLSISEKIVAMSEELTKKLDPVDEHLKNAVSLLSDLKIDMQALSTKIDTKDQTTTEALSKVNTQLNEANRQLSELLRLVALGGSRTTEQQADDHAANVKADKDAFDGPLDPIAAPQPRDKE